MVGALIRQLRMERNYSQAGLAHGICAASYLSKIEQGQVEAGTEILDRLFAALDVEYCRDDALIARAEEELAAYYQAREREESVDEPAAWLDAQADRLLYSDMCLPFQVWRVYRALDRQDRETAEHLQRELGSQQSRMDPEQQYRYLTACAELTRDAEAALSLQQQAEREKPCAMAQYHIAGVLYHLGRYSQCIEAADQAYRMAAEEGDPYVLVWASFLLGSCYTARDMNFAEKYYRRSVRLGRRVEPRLEPWMAYNLGASYLEWGQPEKALYWLSRTSHVENGDRHNLLLEQKKALLFTQLSRPEEAGAAIRQARRILEETLPTMDTWERQTYADMVRFSELQLRGQRDAEYETLLRRIYDQAGEKLGFGFRKFYGRYLIDLYRSQRRYKEALTVMEETQIGLS